MTVAMSDHDHEHDHDQTLTKRHPLSPVTGQQSPTIFRLVIIQVCTTLTTVVAKYKRLSSPFSNTATKSIMKFFVTFKVS